MPAEVIRITGLNGYVVSDSRRRYECVVGACSFRTARTTQRRGNRAKRPSGGSVEWQGGEIRLGLLEVGLASLPFLSGSGNQRSDRQTRPT